MICPSVPAAHIVPQPSAWSYLYFSMTGKLITPIATTLAPTTPVEAARSAPTKIVLIAIPPRISPKSIPMLSSSLSASFDF